MRQALDNTWMKWGTGLIFGVIILAFVLFFGPQTQGLGPGAATWVAKVDGRVINNTELAAAFERYRRLSGNQARLDDAEFADLQRQQALSIAAVEILAERAADAGLAVSDEEVRCFLVNWNPNYAVGGERICQRFPADYPERFRNYDIIWFTETDGRFTQYFDESVRNRFNMAADEYEMRKRSELLARYYLAALGESVEVPPGQVRSVWERRNTTVALDYIALDPEAVGDVDPTDAEVAAWAASNEAAIQAAYDADPNAFAVEREITLSRIYIGRPAADAPDFAEAQSRYESALERATTGGEDFAALARELSENQREADAGGVMGTRTSDTISTDIWDATLEMEVGDVQGIEQDYAWSIIRLDDATEARTRPLDEVRDELAAQLLRDELTAEAAAGLATRGERILELAASAESLGDAAAQEAAERAPTPAEPVEGEEVPEPVAAPSPLPVRNTGAFAMERPSPFLASAGQLPPGIEFPPEPADAVPGIGASRDLVRIAFALTDDAPLHPELIEVEGVEYIVRLTERAAAPAEMPAEEAAAIEAELRQPLVAALIGDENAQAALMMGMPGELPPFVMQVVDEAFASGALKLRAGFFEVEAADPVDEI